MSHFFAILNRMKHIRRWGLMHNTEPENDMEHALLVGLLSHGLALVAKERFHREVDPEHVLALAVYHDASEVMTGDLPTPVKYYSAELRQAYHRMEEEAAQRLLSIAPADLREDFQPYLLPEKDYAWQLVKAADRIAAYIKCMEEQRAGNHEFDAAGEAVLKTIRAIELPEVQAFFAEFVPSFGLTLDEVNAPEVEQA